MWICHKCGTNNEDFTEVCVRCGTIKAVPVPKSPPVPPIAAPRKEKSGAKKIIIPVVIVLLVAAALVCGYFFIHSWEDATCTAPKTCSICGKTSGSPLSHDWQSADCTHPRICTRCDAEEGKPLGHDWEEATYDAPKTCARCGAEEGDPLLTPDEPDGDELAGHWSDEPLKNFGGPVSTNAYILDEPLSGCRGITLTLSIDVESGDPFGTWYFYVQNPEGRWEHVAEFELTSIDTLAADHVLTFDESLDFGAVAIAPKYGSVYTLSYYMALSDPQ